MRFRQRAYLQTIGRLRHFVGEPEILRNPWKNLIMDVNRSYDPPRLVAFGDEDFRQHVQVGPYSSLNRTTEVLLGGNHHPEWLSTYPFRTKYDLPGRAEERQPWSKGPVIIGPEVWIGWRCTVMSGVTIGAGAVVAASSVVTKDVEPFWVVGGNPARPLRRRFDDDSCEALLRISWWEWPHELVLAHVDQLCGGSIRAFIDAHDPLSSDPSVCHSCAGRMTVTGRAGSVPDPRHGSAVGDVP